MTRGDSDDERDDEDEEWELEGVDTSEDWDDDEPTVACPFCRRQIHEDSEQCPYCENYLTRDDFANARKPWWMLAFVALCLYIVYLWIRGPKK